MKLPRLLIALQLRRHADTLSCVTPERNSRSPYPHPSPTSGERVGHPSDQRKITLTTTNDMGAPYHYSGMLSREGENLAGEWQTEKSSRLWVPDNFVSLR